MISDFKVFTIMLLKQLNCGVLSISQLFYVYYKGKTQLFFNLDFLLVLSKKGFSAESCSAIYCLRATCL